MGGTASQPASSKPKVPSDHVDIIGPPPPIARNNTDTVPRQDRDVDVDGDLQLPARTLYSEGGSLEGSAPDSAAGSAATDPLARPHVPALSRNPNSAPSRPRRPSSTGSVASSTFLSKFWPNSANKRRSSIADSENSNKQNNAINANKDSTICINNNISANDPAVLASKNNDDMHVIPLQDSDVASLPPRPHHYPHRSDGDIIYSASDENGMPFESDTAPANRRPSSATVSSLRTSFVGTFYKSRADRASADILSDPQNRPVKEVEVVKGKNKSARRRREMEEEDCNQTGQSFYEMRIQDSYYSTPERSRPSEYINMRDADTTRRDSRAAKKSEKRASREVRKEETLRRKGKTAPPPPDPGTVGYAIQDSKRIGVLNLSKMGLGHIPAVVFEDIPGTTRVINISYNNLETLDVQFTEFVLVQRLIANGNFLSTVPSSISKMTDLRSLDLAHNKLTQLPDVFANMSSLANVNLSDNHLTSLPDSFASLNVVTLRLTGNKVTVPPRVIESMRSLENLYLDKNKIVALPPAWSSLPRLQTLILDDNFIADLPDNFLSDCHLLFNLSIRRNPLKMIRLQSKPSWDDYDARRLAHFRHRIDMGMKTMDEMAIADS